MRIENEGTWRRVVWHKITDVSEEDTAKQVTSKANARYTCYLLPQFYLLGSLFDTEVGQNMFLRKVNKKKLSL
jgi:hypothetical protein